ncbi:DUF202 domain-containing protein [Variovorax sp. J31P179]|uniref:DUF202 domain-containing protein n=1 Tax=Variovorax sp. J31P179 TaxID=3053508 RepID=UPI00257901C1|nr:DUF202 domain-containing protein [Variovorax sp. J31P179]MDM0084705.1 DUF202 domain-containing protein [Variovorax sp. J31P179]
MKKCARQPHAVPFDPGLQGERTALAWSRTAMSIVVCALLELRGLWSMQERSFSGLALALLGCALATFAYGAWRREHLLQGMVPPRVRATWIAFVAVTSALTGVMGCVALVLASA